MRCEHEALEIMHKAGIKQNIAGNIDLTKYTIILLIKEGVKKQIIIIISIPRYAPTSEFKTKIKIKLIS